MWKEERDKRASFPWICYLAKSITCLSIWITENTGTAFEQKIIVIKIDFESTANLHSLNRKSVSMWARVKIVPKIPSNADQLYFKVSGLSGWLTLIYQGNTLIINLTHLKRLRKQCSVPQTATINSTCPNAYYATSQAHTCRHILHTRT